VRIQVDREVCDLHGQCVFTAPELFRFDDDDELVYTTEVPAELEDKARTAATVCPTGAISLLE
jgi:ferredoxin